MFMRYSSFRTLAVATWARVLFLGLRLDLPGGFLLSLQADADGKDAVAVAGGDVVLGGVGRQRQAPGERAVAELRPALAFGLVRPLGVDRQEPELAVTSTSC